MIMATLKKYKKTIPPVPNSVWRKPLHFIAFGFGAGALPFAPGTFGTLIAIPIYLLLARLPLFFYLSAVLMISIGAVFLCDAVEKELAVHDHPGMCVDEIVGYLVTMIAAPAGGFAILLGFLLFRLFDIWKPWPISWLDQNVSGGFGVILDDVVAGLFSCLGIHLFYLICS